MAARRRIPRPNDDFGPDAGNERESYFTWVVEGAVIGMSRPAPTELAALKSLGVTHVISLTMQPLSREDVEGTGLTVLHFPMPDMSAPGVERIDQFVETLSELVHSGRKVAVHCGAGLGRTGTMLACYLVSRGMSADEALQEVRRRRPGSVESEEQEDAVQEYADFLKEK